MLKLYNTLTRSVESFETLVPGVVKMYSCGPTVYRYIHIGNLRTFLMADWLRRTLIAFGYEVRHIKNITDVGHMRVERLDQGEDKLIAQARKEGKTSLEIAAFYTEAFRADEAALNILPAHEFPRATEHIPEMIAIIQGLVGKRLAYVNEGHVFFDVRRFPSYGQLSGNQLEGMLAGVRDNADPFRHNPEDFPLWKLAEPGREMAWDSPWGRGFPGWHIECSAMSLKHLGEQFDIHTGGVDNIFPHHEDEIAQSEGYTGKRLASYWVHAQHLLADGVKMAKSTGNAYTREDVVARGFEPMALRLLFATVHYRSRLNFTFSALRAAETALYRLRGAVVRLAAEAGDGQPKLAEGAGEPWISRFRDALADDLNVPRAIATVWDLLRRDHETSPAMKLALILNFDRVLGLGLAEYVHQTEDGRRKADHGVRGDVPQPVIALVEQRDALRRDRRFAEADAVREQILAAGYHVRDTRSGSVVVRRAPEEEFGSISRPADVPDQSGESDKYDFSINLLSINSRSDLERCIESIVRWRGGRKLEIVVVDNGSTDDTTDYLQNVVRDGLRDADGQDVPLRVFFADHDMGFAAGRNATMRASSGRIVVLLDTSIELNGDIWTPLEHALQDAHIGLVGPYGLVTDDLQEFQESAGPDVDAIEGYMMAFRRALLPEIGSFEEKFRFYRLLDIYESFMFKTAGYRVVALPEVADRIVKHPHREWYSLSEEDRSIKSKKNFDIWKRRWHHGQSLMTANYVSDDRWFGHDHPQHVGGSHTHAPDELPPPGQAHAHKHQHWPDHDHEHPHTHER